MLVVKEYRFSRVPDYSVLFGGDGVLGPCKVNGFVEEPLCDRGVIVHGVKLFEGTALSRREVFEPVYY